MPLFLLAPLTPPVVSDIMAAVSGLGLDGYITLGVTIALAIYVVRRFVRR